MIREIKGDLFDSDDAILAHGCNCKAAMFSGIAKSMAEKYPEMETQYNSLCNNNNFNPGDVFLYNYELGRYIANMGTQFLPGANAKVEYIVDSVASLLLIALTLNISKVSMCRVGSGVGGLAWDDVLQALEEEFGRHQVDIDIYYL